MVKRIREPPDVRRNLKIWFYDTSKQAVGAALIHFINIFTSSYYSGDPCTWYIISFLLDSTLGLLVIYVGLFISQVIARRSHLDQLLLGQYGHTTSEQVRAWLSQFAVYLVVLCVEKLSIALFMIPHFWHKIRDLLLLPFSDSPDLELIVTMLIIPFTVNALMFWLVDNFLMQHGQQERYTKIMTTLHNSRIVYGPNKDQFGDAQVLIFNSVEEQRLEADINPFLVDATATALSEANLKIAACPP
ncbi:store-operated calcium entry regulator STIMATE-like [Symsagittifera roscoffensis]|uniref:store-operated calcium entry regulator STIMATE-like n=1 Tax=Symsagittifera roscoffensis TaxID=84072 RepID=UPI00307CA4BD